MNIDVQSVNIKKVNPMKKIYSCCICHKELDYKPVRLVKQLYGLGRIKNQYGYCTKYDFCNNCYSKFANWINKNRKED